MSNSKLFDCPMVQFLDDSQHVILAVPASHGQNIGKSFAEEFSRFTDISAEQERVLRAGPDDEFDDYFPTWERVIDHCQVFDRDTGRHYNLMQNEHGDLLFVGVTIDICLQDHAANPRDDDNLGVMYFLHRRYDLGDRDAEDIFVSVDMCQKCNSKTDVCRCDEPDDVVSRELRSDVAFFKPVYMYDHSGLSFSHGSFNDSWDSGCLGVHYVTKAAIQESFPKWDVDHLTEEQTAQLDSILQAELTTYEYWVAGQVWRVAVDTLEGEWVYAGNNIYGHSDDAQDEAKLIADPSMHFLIDMLDV